MRITIKLMLILVLASTPAGAANIFVPGDHETIQEAVDAASPGDRILVAEGNYKGAIITKRVKISGVGDETVITEGCCGVFFEAGFFLHSSGADGAQISDLSITLSDTGAVHRTGISGREFGDGSPVRVAVRNVKFVNLDIGVFARFASGWRITDNVVEGLRETPHSNLSIGIWLSGSGNFLVANNTINHDGPGLAGQIYVGINLSGGAAQTENNKLVNNTISVEAAVAAKANDIELFTFSPDCDGPIIIFDNKVVNNDAQNVLFTPSCLVDHNVFR